MSASRTTSVIAALAIGLAIAGCGDKKTPASGESPQSSAASTAAPTTAPIDACKLISGEDIARVLGKPIEGSPTGTGPDMPGCMWENTDSFESVSLEIGNPGTAINGTLPPPEPGFPQVGRPGPDGMLFLGNGMVEFAAGGRSNTLQVALVNVAGGAADDAAVDLARKVGPQLPQ